MAARGASEEWMACFCYSPGSRPGITRSAALYRACAACSCGELMGDSAAMTDGQSRDLSPRAAIYGARSPISQQQLIGCIGSGRLYQTVQLYLKETYQVLALSRENLAKQASMCSLILYCDDS